MATVAVLLALAVAAVWFVFRFIDDERERDLQSWQARLGIVADSRAGAINAWFETDLAGELESLADNEALQIYMTQLARGAAPEDSPMDRAQASYLRNLLVVTADRGGFHAPVSGPAVPANVRRIGVAGIALLSMDGDILVATPGMPPLEGELAAFFMNMERGRGNLLDLHRGPSGRLAMGLAVPVYRIQGNARPSEQIGWVMGIRPVGSRLYDFLSQPGEVHESAENMLVRRRDGMIEYLSPLKDGSAPLERRFAADTAGLAAAALVSRSGGFVAARDYRDRHVLAVSRPLARLPWQLVAKIDRAEALAGADNRRKRLLVGALLALGLVSALLVALWRHGASRRASDAARRHADIATRFKAQSRLLKLVTDSQPSAIAIIDPAERYRFANAEAARLAGLSTEEILGKTMAAVLGPAEARRRRDLIRQVVDTQQELSATLSTGGAATGEAADDGGDDGGDGGRVVQAVYVPLHAEEGTPLSVLTVETDITEAVTERARRERILNQLVRTLMMVVDRRDPYAAHQSERTAELAAAIAREMDLDPVLVQTVEVAGNLMNLGKILVPSDILTKTETLTEDEMRQVRDSLQASADLIQDIEFDGPVVDCLRHLQEHWDGSGTPRGLRGDAIPLAARIVAVANAFVAMVSPRAYRSGISIDEALSQIMAQAGKSFDRRAVIALANYLDNRGGREAWAARLDSPA